MFNFAFLLLLPLSWFFKLKNQIFLLFFCPFLFSCFLFQKKFLFFNLLGIHILNIFFSYRVSFLNSTFSCSLWNWWKLQDWTWWRGGVQIICWSKASSIIECVTATDKDWMDDLNCVTGRSGAEVKERCELDGGGDWMEDLKCVMENCVNVDVGD